jgi:hypothetical protein
VADARTPAALAGLDGNGVLVVHGRSLTRLRLRPTRHERLWLAVCLVGLRRGLVRFIFVAALGFERFQLVCTIVLLSYSPDATILRAGASKQGDHKGRLYQYRYDVGAPRLNRQLVFTASPWPA